MNASNVNAKPRNNKADRASIIGKVSRNEIREMDRVVARNAEIEAEAARVRAARKNAR